MNFETLQIVSYNIQKSHSAFDSLFNNTLTSPISIIALQEPPTIPSTNHLRKWPQHYCDPIYPSTNSETRPYTAIYIKRSFKNKIYSIDQINIPSPNIIGLSIKISQNSAPLTFINIYNRPDDDVLPLIIDLIKRKAHAATHICGDFNLHHPLWNPTHYRTSPEEGAEILVNHIVENGYHIVNPLGVPTRYGNNSATTIDLYLISSHVEHVDQALCSINDDLDTISDHQPLHLIIPTDYYNKEQDQRWNYKKANWPKGKQKLQDLLHRNNILPINTKDDLERAASVLTTNITKAIKSCTPPMRITSYSKRWWTEELTQLRKQVKKKRRIAQKTQDEWHKVQFKQARAFYKRSIRAAKSKCWNDFLENIKPNNIHKAAKYVKTNREAAPFIPPICKDDGNFTNSPEELAQTFFKHLLGGTDAHTNDFYSNFTNTASFHPVNRQELVTAINYMKDNKTPGPDQIPVQAIKEFRSEIEIFLVEIANASIRLSYYPSCFKESYCIVIPKSNKKSYKEAKSYRPISLLNHLSKIIEAVITKRLQYEMDSKRLIPPTHFGCRKGSGTDDALTFVTEHIKNAWKRKMVTAAIALDAQGAFNNVNHEILLQECQDAGISTPLIGWIAGFLRCRTLQFKFTNHTSNIFSLTKGSPQGSPISGPLYLLYNRRMLMDQEHIVKVGYADDILWLSSHRTPTEARQTLESALPTAEAWSESHETPLDISKTQYVLFNRNYLKKDSTAINWNNKQILQSESMKYLGIILDSKLSFTSQTNVMAQRGYGAMASLSRLANTKRGVPTKQFITLYKTHVCAATDYASHVWINSTRTSKASRILDKIQNIAMRKALGALRTTPVTYMCFDTALSPPLTRINMKAEKYVLRCNTKPDNNLIKHIIHRIIYRPRRKFTSPLIAAVKNVRKYIDITSMEQCNPHPFEPWQELKIYFNIPQDKETAIQHHKQYMQVYPNGWHYYTDGSMNDKSVAAAFFGGDEANSCAYKIGSADKFSIYEAELIGLYEAFRHIYHKVTATPYTLVPSAILVHTDSQAAYYALVNYHKAKTGQYIIKSIIREIDLLRKDSLRGHVPIILNWVPGHKDIKGNEEADSRSKAARDDNTWSRRSPNIQMKPSISVLKCRIHRRNTELLRVPAHRLNDGCSARINKARGKLSSKESVKVLDRLPRKARIIATQLRSGHFPTIKTYRYRFKLSDSPRCTTCNIDDTIFHRIFVCKRFNNLRIQLRQQLYEKQCRFEFNSMMHNSEALLALTKFFTTQV